MPGPEGLGAAFSAALAAKDFARIADLLHPEIDFRGMTPNRAWEAHTPQEVVDDVLRIWFEDGDEVEETVALQTDGFAGCQRVGYRLTGNNAGGPFVVEQQAYLEERDGQIGWMRILCSGFRRPG